MKDVKPLRQPETAEQLRQPETVEQPVYNTQTGNQENLYDSQTGKYIGPKPFITSNEKHHAEVLIKQRQLEVLIKTYNTPKEFNRDAKKMLRDGWAITNQSQTGSNAGLGRKTVKFMLFWPALFLKGGDKIMVTWSR